MIANSEKQRDRDKLQKALSSLSNKEDIINAGRRLYGIICLRKNSNDPIIKYERIARSFNTIYKSLRKKMNRLNLITDPNDSFEDSEELNRENIEADAQNFESLRNLINAIGEDHLELLRLGLTLDSYEMI